MITQKQFNLLVAKQRRFETNLKALEKLLKLRSPFVRGKSGGIVQTGDTFLTVIGDYEAAIAEASHSFTFTAVDFDDDSEVMIIIDGSVTAAAAIQVRINSEAGASYFQDGRRIASGVETLIDQNSENEFDVCSATMLQNGGDGFFAVIKISFNKSGTLDRPRIISESVGGSVLANEQVSGMFNVATATLTDIVMRTSTSTWDIGTRITVYKLSRA